MYTYSICICIYYIYTYYTYTYALCIYIYCVCVCVCVHTVPGTISTVGERNFADFADDVNVNATGVCVLLLCMMT